MTLYPRIIVYSQGKQFYFTNVDWVRADRRTLYIFNDEPASSADGIYVTALKQYVHVVGCFSGDCAMDARP